MIGIVLTDMNAAGVVAGTAALRLSRYRKWFRMPANRADRVSGGEVRNVSALQADADGVELPADVDLRGQTVLLQLTLEASPLGYWIDPYIEMQDGQLIHRQYYERGAAGTRYLNLSLFFPSSGRAAPARLGLRGSGLAWQPDAVLLIYAAPRIEAESVLVIAPHPDDAEIAAFGMYADRRSWVATITAGEKATANLPAEIVGPARSHWAALLRVNDSLTIPTLGHVPPDRRVNLVFPDGVLESMYREPSRTFQLACEATLSRRELRLQNAMPEFRECEASCNWDGLVEELGRLIDITQPDIIICPHPLIDAHSDHAYATVALQRAMCKRSGRRAKLLLYAVHTQGAALYPPGPRTSVIGLPPGHFAGNVADCIYSHSLSTDLQRRKFFAIDAMHATRAPAASILRQMSRGFAGVGCDPTSFLRRAPRPNEIYYIAHEALLSKLVDRRLVDDSARSPAP